MNSKLLASIFLTWFCANLLGQPQSPAPYGPMYFLKFGDYLFEKSDYARAATEYERFLFFQNPDTFPEIHYKIGLSYYRLNAYPQAKRFFQSALRLPSAATFQDTLRLSLAALELRTRDVPVLDSIISPSLSASQGLSLRFRLYAALAELKKENFSAALAQIPGDTVRDSNQTEYGFFRVRKIAQRGLHLPHKVPWKAALLSSLVPGAGKLYTGNTGDGLYSFLLVAGTGFLSYRGYKRGDPFQTYFFGAAALFFYSGNIYGSFLSAKLFNRRSREKLRREIQDEINYWTDL